MTPFRLFEYLCAVAGGIGVMSLIIGVVLVVYLFVVGWVRK